MRRLLCILFLLLWPAGAVRADEPDMAFQHSLDLLDADMKLRILRRLREREVYIPRERVRRYAEEKRELAAELNMDGGTDLRSVEGWATAAATVRKAEKQSMLLVAEAWGKKILKAAASDDKDNPGYLTALREWEQQRLKWRSDKTCTASAVAASVEQLARRCRQDHLGTRWQESACRIYRGAIKDRNNLVNRVVELDRLRLANEASLATLKVVREQLDLIEKAQKLQKDPTGFLKEEAEKKIFERLTKRYPDANMANVKWAWGKAKDCFSNASSAYSKVGELDNDPNLKAFPQTLSTAKKFAVLGAVYKSTLGVVKDLAIAEPLGPFIDVLEFYGEGINLVPTVAQKMSSALARFGQQKVRRVGRWGDDVFARVPYDNLWKTDLRAFGIEAATPQAVPDGDAQLTFLLVPKKVVPRGFATLSKEQYVRLNSAVADERILKLMREHRSDGLLAHDADADLLKTVATEAKATPFGEEDQLALAQGHVVSYEGAKWSAQRFATRADTEIELATLEMRVREALLRYSAADVGRWKEFRAVLESHGVALAPDRTIKLFNFFANVGQRDLLDRVLERIARERAQRRLGTPKVGVPIVESPPDDEMKPGSTVDLRAGVMVGGLKPGRTVEADLIWVMPTWAKSQDAMTGVTLTNGLNLFERKFRVPADVTQKPFEIKVAIEVKPGPYDEAPTTATGVGTFGFIPPKSGPLTIECRRPPTGGGGNQILARSETIGGIDKQPEDKALRVTLYYAYSADGPWTKAEDSKRDIRAGQEINPESTRMAADRVMLWHFPGSRRRAEEGAPRPLYYRVGQQILDEDRPTGEEELSDVAGPGKPVLIFRQAPKDGGPIEARSSTEGDLAPAWLETDVELALDNQEISFWDAHVVVTAGQWTGHFWTPRREGDRRFGITGTGYSGTFARIRVPFRPEEQTVTVTATAQEVTATARITLRPSAADAAKAKRAAQSIAKSYEAFKADVQESADNAQQRAESTTNTFYKLRWQQRQETRQQLLAPRGRLGSQAKIAEAMGNWEAALAAWTQRMAYDATERDIAKRYAQLFDGYWRKQHDRERDPAKRTSKANWRRDQLEQRTTAAETIYYQRQAQHRERAARVALLAGEAGAVRQHTQARIKAIEELRRRGGKQTPRLSGILLWEAEAVAIAGGDRQAAAALFIQARKHALGEGGHPPSWTRGEQLPPWLPPGVKIVGAGTTQPQPRRR